MPQEKPEDIGGAANQEKSIDAAQGRVIPLRRKELINRIRQQPEVDQAPDRKRISGRDEKDRKAVGNLSSGFPVQRQGVGQEIDQDGDGQRYKIKDGTGHK